MKMKLKKGCDNQQGDQILQMCLSGSPAEMCQLQTGDEVLTVNGQQVAEMSYTAWKSSLEEALQEGSLVMDIRRHGQNSESSAPLSVFVCEWNISGLHSCSDRAACAFVHR